MPYFCITVTLLVVFCCAPPVSGIEELDISACIPGNSARSLGQTASCTCHIGGRGGAGRRTCGQSRDIELVDLVCSGVSAVDLPADEVYNNITCL